ARLQRELVREEVADDVHADGERGKEPEGPAADCGSDREEQAGEARDQQPRTQMGRETGSGDVHWESPVRLIDDDQPKVSPARFVGGRRARAMMAVLTSSARSGIVPLGTRDGTDQDGATTGGASGGASVSAASAAW